MAVATSTTRFSALQNRRIGRVSLRQGIEPRSLVLATAQNTAQSEFNSAGENQPRVAVVGAGWAGWAATKALRENGVKVIVFDGKPFEAGTRGFWKDYPNIEALLLELGLNVSDVFTDFTSSSFYSPYGLEATAPVFSRSSFPELPSPLGQVVATFSNFKRLPVADRGTVLGLLYAMLDLTRDRETFEAYDRMTAHELFIRMGLSKRLVDDFIRPTLLVGLFKPPEELSAAVAMELLYYYALAHQDSFDVRWIRQKSIAETIINPLARRLQEGPGLDVQGGCRVERLLTSAGRVTGLEYRDMRTGEVRREDGLDGCVLALGAKGMKGVVGGSPDVARMCPELSAAASLGSIDVLATRIWLDRVVPTDTPANVLSNFPEQRGAGATFFMLDQLQPDEAALWGGEEPKGSVVACDFYNSAAVATLSDEDIVGLLMNRLLPSAVPAFKGAKVVDSHVQRFPGAVTWFSPGSFSSRPPLQTSIPNLVCAGDWVRMGEREHGAKGLCQERAYVTGLEAANALARSGSLGKIHSKIHPVIPIREDEPQVKLGQQLNAAAMSFFKPLGLDSPWVR